ncbi:MAG: ABC transporter permease [Armatimonadota bacterium]|nr:ABC transporter permease [Armatimonadota bacterium]MDR7549149.1 ABC transporter permease [Armatimonadota bacterium]
MGRVEALTVVRPRRGWRPLLRRFVHVPLLAPAVGLSIAVFWTCMAVLVVMSVYPFLAAGTPRFTWAAWQRFLVDPYYWGVVGTTLRLAVVVTGLSLLIGYPAAYAISKIQRPGWALAAYVVLFAPILVSVVVRTYGWLLLLSNTGVVNYVLRALGLIREPIPLIFNTTGIVIAMVHILLPFAVFPILSVVGQLERDLKDAAMDLGATRWQTFRRVTLPLTLPGIIAGAQIVFTLTVSAFVTPFLMGGGKVQILSGLIYRDMEAVNLGFAAVVALVLLTLAAAILAASNLLARRTYSRAEVARA